MGEMLDAAGRESVVPPQAPARPAARQAQYCHVLRMQDARLGRPSYSAVMRPDLPFALGGATLGALLLADAAIAPDAGPIRPLDVVLIVVAAAAVALCRRFPVPAPLGATAAEVAPPVRGPARGCAALPVLA